MLYGFNYKIWNSEPNGAQFSLFQSFLGREINALKKIDCADAYLTMVQKIMVKESGWYLLWFRSYAGWKKMSSSSYYDKWEPKNLFQIKKGSRNADRPYTYFIAKQCKIKKSNKVGIGSISIPTSLFYLEQIFWLSLVCIVFLGAKRCGILLVTKYRWKVHVVYNFCL